MGMNERLARCARTAMYPEARPWEEIAEDTQGMWLRMADRLLSLGVTLPPEPPKWEASRVNGYVMWDGVGRIVAWDGDGTQDHALARRLAAHLNTTGFTPDATEDVNALALKRMREEQERSDEIERKYR